MVKHVVEIEEDDDERFAVEKEQEAEQILEARHNELIQTIEAIKPVPIDLSPISKGLDGVVKITETARSKDLNIILSKIEQEFAKMTTALVTEMKTNRYSSIEPKRNKQGLIESYKLNPINTVKGN